MTERVGEKIQTADDPSGSIFLLERPETEDDFRRLRQQVIFGRGVFRGAGLGADEIERILSEIRAMRVARFGHQVVEMIVDRSL